MDDKQYVPGIGPIAPKLLILGDCPTEADVRAGKPLTDRELGRLLSELNIQKESCWQTNVSKYHVPPSPRDKKIPFYIRAKNAGIDLDEQLRDLQNEISSVNPNCILALGTAALWALSGKTKISQYRGSILYGMSRKFVPTYNPAHLSWQSTDSEFTGYWNRQVILFDIKRALEESYSPVYQLPSRNLQVCRNSAQLADFIKRYEKHTRPAIDIEALNCIPSCIGLSFDPSEAISIPLWNERNISKIPDSDLVSIWILLAELLAKNDIVGQNLKYDEDKIKRLGFKVKSVFSDTMLKAFAINPELPKSLAFNTSIYTREPYYKDEGADFDIGKQSIDDLFIYNARDAAVTKEIDLAQDADLDEIGQRKYYENFIMKLHPLYMEIENTGFRVDEAARERLLRRYIKWDEETRYQLFKIAGDEINCNSPLQVKNLLFTIFKLPPRASLDEENLTEMLNSATTIKNEEHRKAIELILLDRRIIKTISTYLMAGADFDGRMKTTYFLALETGRTSTGQQDPPIRPTVEIIDHNGKKAKKVLGTAFQTFTKHGDVGDDLREMFIADEGDVFVQADSSQAEARVVFLLADDEQALKDIDEHDYHALTASWFFGGTESDYSKKVLGYESPIRFAGKTLRHAGHLGAGERRAATELNTQARKYHIPIRITSKIAKTSLDIFHRKQPKIRSGFHAGIIEALEKNKRTLIAPVLYGIDAEFGGRRTFFERWGDELFRQAFSYIPQRTVSDNTKAAALRIKARLPEIKIIVEAHDALLFSFPQRYLNKWSKIIKEEMERPIDFSHCSLPRRSLVIPCDVEVGYDYKNLDKFSKFVIRKVA